MPDEKILKSLVKTSEILFLLGEKLNKGAIWVCSYYYISLYVIKRYNNKETSHETYRIAW